MTKATPTAAPVETAPAETAPTLVMEFEDTDAPARTYATRAPKVNPYADKVAALVSAYKASPETFKAKRGTFADKDLAEKAARYIAKAARDNSVTMRKTFVENADASVTLVFWFTDLVKSAPRGPRKPKGDAAPAETV